jgi:hypothetical protein
MRKRQIPQTYLHRTAAKAVLVNRGIEELQLGKVVVHDASYEFCLHFLNPR